MDVSYWTMNTVPAQTWQTVVETLLDFLALQVNTAHYNANCRRCKCR